MATTYSTRLTSVEAGNKSKGILSKGQLRAGIDSHAVTTAELELNDVILYDIELPSGCIFDTVSIYNDDLDSNGTPALVLDIGVAAKEDFTSVTSSVETKHSKDDVLDADLFVDGSTAGQAATTNWTVLAPDAATFGPDDAGKAIWELLGYDKDPNTLFRVAVTVATAAATAAAGDLALKVTFLEY